MAQEFIFENDTQTTVDFSTVTDGDGFVYSGEAYWKLDNNNPNAVKLSDSAVYKLNDTAQVIIPGTAIIKFE